MIVAFAALSSSVSPSDAIFLIMLQAAFVMSHFVQMNCRRWCPDSQSLEKDRLNCLLMRFLHFLKSQ